MGETVEGRGLAERVCDRGTKPMRDHGFAGAAGRWQSETARVVAALVLRLFPARRLAGNAQDERYLDG